MQMPNLHTLSENSPLTPPSVSEWKDLNPSLSSTLASLWTIKTRDRDRSRDRDRETEEEQSSGWDVEADVGSEGSGSRLDRPWSVNSGIRSYWYETDPRRGRSPGRLQNVRPCLRVSVEFGFCLKLASHFRKHNGSLATLVKDEDAGEMELKKFQAWAFGDSCDQKHFILCEGWDRYSYYHFIPETKTWSEGLGLLQESRFRPSPDSDSDSCVVVSSQTKTMSVQSCSEAFPFLCSRDNLVLLEEKMSWEQALEACGNISSKHRYVPPPAAPPDTEDSEQL
ncbi:hypothetical protein WMY93_012835 [Mugilogobius chulae]|uniref:C-type lectin domain-containing protein n=1 Tax=Mugilogobius chulae TaxID=88201 RepID=A0AAW0P9V7_9GOBI